VTLTIQPNARAVLDYTIRLARTNEVVDASTSEGGEPIAYVHGYGMLVPGLERGLVGLAAGDRREIEVAPEEAYGLHDEELVVEVARSEMPRPKKVKIGDEIVAESEDGDEAVLRVIEVKEDLVVLDGNHPLAGETLRYEVTVREVREATEEEIAEAAEAFEEAEAEHAGGEHGNGAHAHGQGQGQANETLVQLGRSKK
jgi:FKBP-type peptidyl-prolyl cis-trans isomerase SlyD